MKVRRFAYFVAPWMLGVLAIAQAQQQAPVGMHIPPLGAGPWVFDTHEQHRIRVSVVTRGLSHPWAIAFLPDGAC
jgi:glucose/arabinose dehydrogenase